MRCMVHVLTRRSLRPTLCLVLVSASWLYVCGRPAAAAERGLRVLHGAIKGVKLLRKQGLGQSRP